MEANFTEEILKKWYKKWWGVLIILFGLLILSIFLIIGGQSFYYYRQIKSGKMPLPGETKFQQSNTPISNPKEIDLTKLSPEGEPASSPGAPLTIVGFFDFQCPFSQEGNSVMRQMQTTYGDKVNFVFRNFPLTDIHPNAMLAAQAAECANSQNKFWQMSDKIFSDSKLDRETLLLYSGQISLDAKQFSECLDDYQSKGLVLKDLLDGQTEGVGGTPTWFISGEKIEGVIPLDAFKKIIDYLLTKK